MSEKSSFFNSVLVNGKRDRTRKAEDFARYFSLFIGNGVFPNPSTGLQVVSYTGMAIKIKAGQAYINGYFYENDSEYNFTLDNADGVANRIDSIVVRWDLLARSINLFVKKGTFAVNPVVPTLTRTADTYELQIATVYIKGGVIAITQADITDTRLDSAKCGIVTQTVNTVDTTTLYAQIQADMAHFKGVEQAEFIEWVNSLADILDENTAGNLLNLINNHKDDMQSHISVLAHTRTGTSNPLTGTLPTTGMCVRTIKPTHDCVAGDTYTINGVAYTAQTTGGQPLENEMFKAGVPLDCTIDVDGKTINFKQGGGGGLPKSWKDEVTALTGEAVFKDADIGLVRNGNFNEGIDLENLSKIFTNPNEIESTKWSGVAGGHNAIAMIKNTATGNNLFIYTKTDKYNLFQSITLGNQPFCIDISRDGNLIVIGVYSNPWILFYYKNSTTGQYEKLANPNVLPSSTINKIKISNSGTKICGWGQVSYPNAYFSLYQFNQDKTIISIKNEAQSALNDIAFGGTGNDEKFAYTLNNTVKVFSLSTGYNLIQTITVAASQPCYGLSFNDGADTLVVHHSTLATNLNLFKFENNSYVIKNILSGVYGSTVDFVDNTHVVISDSTNHMRIVSIENNTLVFKPNPLTLPSALVTTFNVLEGKYLMCPSGLTTGTPYFYDINPVEKVFNLTYEILLRIVQRGIGKIGIALESKAKNEQLKGNYFKPINDKIGV